MKKIIYLGYLVDHSEAIAASGASVAGNKMQWSVVTNLSKIEGFDIECITITPYAAFPRDKNIYIKKSQEILNGHIKSERIGYLNLPIIKQLWQIRGVYRQAKKKLKKNPEATVFGFNLFPQIGTPIRRLKKKFPKADFVCLLADLPIDDKTGRRGISKFLRRLFEKNTEKNLTVCDKYIVLNKKVSELYLKDKPYIVIDGGVDKDDIKKSLCYERKTPVEKNILFCGALTEYNGIVNLISAMEGFRGSDIFCDIYGGGHLADAVRSAAESNPNIRYHGKVDNATVMQKQREAWMLINPRVTDDPIAQVTFPSKTFEYLLSGTPVISTRLNGYTEEYDSLMLYYDGNSDDFADKIKFAEADYAKMQIMADRARKFILDTRQWDDRVKDIAEFIYHKV